MGMTIITHGADTITPTQVLGYQSEREGRNIVHPILGRPHPDVTLRPAALRTGTLSLGFAGPTAEGDSRFAENLHGSGGVFTLMSAERPTVPMLYVVAGRIGRELEDQTRDAWIVNVDFQEVYA